MVDIAFNHQGYDFGVVVDDWGTQHSAELAAMNLKHWVETLSQTETGTLHYLLRKSAEAYGDDPVWETREMTALCRARTSARAAALAAAESGMNQGHSCDCRLLPLPLPPE